MAKIVLKSEGKEKTFLFEEAMRIGRSKDNDIVLNNLSVSRNHARLRSENGRFILVDLNSANGTLVNGRKISKIDIVNGDVINIGKQELLFLNEDEELSLDAGMDDLDRTMMVDTAPECYLTVKKGKKSTKNKIERIETSIGRGGENAIRLPDLFASKRHALILRQGKDYYVRDLGSWRGTLLNGKPIKEADGPFQLKNNDEIKIGSCTLVFSMSGGQQMMAKTIDKTKPSMPAPPDMQDSAAVGVANPLAEDFSPQAMEQAAVEEETPAAESDFTEDYEPTPPIAAEEDQRSSADKFIDDFVAGTDNMLEQDSPIEPESTPVVPVSEDTSSVTDEFQFETPGGIEADQDAFAAIAEEAAQSEQEGDAALEEKLEQVRRDSLTPVEEFLNNERWQELDQMAAEEQAKPVSDMAMVSADAVEPVDEPEHPIEEVAAFTIDEESSSAEEQAGASAAALVRDVAEDLELPDAEEAEQAAASDDAAALVSQTPPPVEEAVALVEEIVSDEGESASEEELEAEEDDAAVETEPAEDMAESAAAVVEDDAASSVETIFDDDEPEDSEAFAQEEEPAAEEASAIAGETLEGSEALEDDERQRQVAIWKQALNNKSEAIKREARRRLKELTGEDYE